MDNFKVIYKILKVLEKAMDVDELDTSLISSEALGITQRRWCAIIEMLAYNEYVKGVGIVKTLGYETIKINNIKITLKGLEYLDENSLMKKAANLAKGIADIIP